MRKRLCFSFRPREDEDSHRRAWNLLQQVPKGRKTDFLVRAILEQEEKSQDEERLRSLLREELKRAGYSTVSREKENKPEIPTGMLDFLSGL